MQTTLSFILSVLGAMQQANEPACSYTSHRRGCEIHVTHLQSLCGFLYDIYCNRYAAEVAS